MSIFFNVFYYLLTLLSLISTIVQIIIISYKKLYKSFLFELLLNFFIFSSIFSLSLMIYNMDRKQNIKETNIENNYKNFVNEQNFELNESRNLENYFKNDNNISNINYENYFAGNDFENTNNISCQIQGSLISFFEIGQYLWASLVSNSIYYNIVEYKTNQEEFNNSLRTLYYIISYLTPTIFTSTAFFTNSIGPSGNFCWINDINNGSKQLHIYQIVIISLYHAFQVFIILINFITTFRVINYIRRELNIDNMSEFDCETKTNASPFTPDTNNQVVNENFEESKEITDFPSSKTNRSNIKVSSSKFSSKASNKVTEFDKEEFYYQKKTLLTYTVSPLIIIFPCMIFRFVGLFVDIHNEIVYMIYILFYTLQGLFFALALGIKLNSDNCLFGIFFFCCFKHNKNKNEFQRKTSTSPSHLSSTNVNDLDFQSCMSPRETKFKERMMKTISSASLNNKIVKMNTQSSRISGYFEDYMFSQEDNSLNNNIDEDIDNSL